MQRARNEIDENPNRGEAETKKKKKKKNIDLLLGIVEA